MLAFIYLVLETESRAQPEKALQPWAHTLSLILWILGGRRESFPETCLLMRAVAHTPPPPPIKLLRLYFKNYSETVFQSWNGLFFWYSGFGFPGILETSIYAGKDPSLFSVLSIKWRQNSRPSALSGHRALYLQPCLEPIYPVLTRSLLYAAKEQCVLAETSEDSLKHLFTIKFLSK